ncbi:MAG: TetR/AcrR family transcriptional regulator [Actinobacteria bacterium]|nr:TetR/AcrR family transcriptional regulator [Actinomycetota bacterium]
MAKPRGDRRQQIADATLKIVGEYGVQGTTMARVAQKVGISGPALYKHFANRAEMLEAAMDLLLERVVSWLDSSTNPNALERLRELGYRHASSMAANYEGVVAPLFEFAASGPRSHLTEQMARRQRAALQKFIDIIAEGQRQGTIRGDIDIEVAAWSLIGLTWVENFAMLEGLNEFIADGTSTRMLEGILATIATPAAAP